MINNRIQNKQIPNTVGRWIRVAAIALLNVLVLSFLAAYFSNQRLDLMTTIGIVADTMGVVTGLLGIWFFFLAEQLNRSTAINVERTTKMVEELQKQMWNMIERTFSTLIARDEEGRQQEARVAVGALREVELPDQYSKALDVVARTIADMEIDDDEPTWLRILREEGLEPYPPNDLRKKKRVPYEELAATISMNFLNKFPATISALAAALDATYNPKQFGERDWFDPLRKMTKDGYLTPVDATLDTLTPESKLDAGPELGPYLKWTREARKKLGFD